MEQPCSALRSALNLCDKEDSVVVVRSQPMESHSCDRGMRLDVGVIELRTNEAAHNPPHPFGDLGVASLESMRPNSTNIYLLGP